MPFNVNNFQAALKGGGARNSLFEVQIFSPFGGDTTFMCKGASIPAATIGVIDVPYYGRQVKVAGNRTFETWTPTIINDEDFAIRASMERWNQSINEFVDNTRTLGTGSPSSYKSTANIWQYGQSGAFLRAYTLFGIFPSNISTIDLAWDTEGIEEFTVDFTYDYWESLGGGGGPSVGVSVGF